MIYFLLVILGVILCSGSQLLLKLSASEGNNSIFKMIFNWKVIISYGVMFLALIINVLAMRNGVLLKDMAILESSGYVFVPILSYLILKESIDIHIIISIVLVIVGIFIFYM